MSQAGEEPFPQRDAEPALMSEFSSDAVTDLEDTFCHFQPLPETVSPLSTSNVADLPMSPSRYPVLAMPDIASAAFATLVSPTPIRVVHSLRTIDAFPTYAMSPDVSANLVWGMAYRISSVRSLLFG